MIFSVVEVIESAPFVCVCVCARTTEQFDIWTKALPVHTYGPANKGVNITKRLLSKRTAHWGDVGPGGHSNRKGVRVGDPQKNPVFEPG